MKYKDLPVLCFLEKEEFYDWLKDFQKTGEPFWMRYYKKSSKKSCVQHTDAVDVALCWGYIDGLLNKYDEESYVVRFSPRRAKSVWSKINVEKVQRLIESGQMQPEGLRHVEAAMNDGRWDAAYGGQSVQEIPPILEEYLAKDDVLLAKYESLTRAEKYTMYFKITTSVGEERKRLAVSRIIEQLRKL